MGCLGNLIGMIMGLVGGIIALVTGIIASVFGVVGSIGAVAVLFASLLPVIVVLGLGWLFYLFLRSSDRPQDSNLGPREDADDDDQTIDVDVVVEEDKE